MLTTSKKKAVVQILLKWHQKNRREFLWRKTKDPYVIFVAEFFLQRTPANRVAAILPTFLEEFPTLEKLSEANFEKIARSYATLGLKKRLLWLIESMKIIFQEYDSKVPSEYSNLISLPGVGEYTASAILCFAYKRDVSIVDTNVVRVLSRIFGLYEIEENLHLTSRNIANDLLPTGKSVEYNESLLDFAALVCKKHPLCQLCLLSALCCYYKGLSANSN